MQQHSPKRRLPSVPAQLSLAPEYAPVRKQALASLRGLLAEPPADGATPVDASYARTALQQLTAQEAALLLDWRAAAAGDAPWCAPPEGHIHLKHRGRPQSPVRPVSPRARTHLSKVLSQQHVTLCYGQQCLMARSTLSFFSSPDGQPQATAFLLAQTAD